MSLFIEKKNDLIIFIVSMGNSDEEIITADNKAKPEVLLPESLIDAIQITIIITDNNIDLF